MKGVIRHFLIILMILIFILQTEIVDSSSSNSVSPQYNNKVESNVDSIKPSKIDSGLDEILWHYEHPEKWRPPEMEKVFAQAEKVGGLSIGFTADHELTENELSELERDFGVKFYKSSSGSVVHTGKIYAPIVPIDKIKALANLPYIENVSTGSWPPGVLPGS